MLNARNGSFSESAEARFFNERNLLKGYQSNSKKTTGRVIATGLLDRARTKKPSDRRYRRLKYHLLEPSAGAESTSDNGSPYNLLSGIETAFSFKVDAKYCA
jgi:hypothetical protein